jgi:hypothetical protein
VPALPPIFYRAQSLVCEMINSCCPSIKPRLAEYLDVAMIGGRDVLATACIGNRRPQSFVNTCPMVHQFVKVAQDADFQKYTNLITTALSRMESSSIIVQHPCSSDEAYATLCDWTQRNSIKSCERKTLVYVAQHNSDDDYQTFVRESKKNLRSFNDVMNRAFPRKNPIKTTMSSTTIRIETNLLLLSSPTKQSPRASSATTQKMVWISIILLAPILSIFSCYN